MMMTMRHIGAALALACGVVLTTNIHASTGCAGDLDGDHQTTISDLLTVINAWGPCAGCVGDITSNGMVNIDDLLVVLNTWGACACTPQNGCLAATRLWCENFEHGNYSRWTGGYSNWSSCATTGFALDKWLSPLHAQRSQVSCSAADSHRGYGGLRFNGDVVLPSFTISSPGGIDAPNGVVVSYWSWLSTPHTFSPTQWMSFLTIVDDCSNNWTGVIGLNLDDSTGRLKPSHMTSVTYASNAPAFPLQQWVRTTAYVNYYTGEMHVWQNGQKVASAAFTRPVKKMCQWHWGLYASGNNSNIILYEDDISVVKLNQPMTNFTIEPWFAANLVPCP
jgi:hypothetical protein